MCTHSIQSVNTEQQLPAVVLRRTHCCSGALRLSSCAALQHLQTARWWQPEAHRGVSTFGRPAAGGCCAPGPRTTGCVVDSMLADTQNLRCTGALEALTGSGASGTPYGHLFFGG